MHLSTKFIPSLRRSHTQTLYFMDSSPSSTSLISCKKFKSENHTPKKRKVNDDEKTVVRVKVGMKKGDQEQKNEGPPPDSWSWRKYGQKPISGSPYPRGYYRCSTTKGCSAKKQVERSKEDSSILIITYTSAHNHPRPKWAQNHILKKNRAQVPDPAQTGKAQSEPRTPEQACNNKGKDGNSRSDQGHQGHFPYMQSPNEGKMLAKVEEDEPYMVTLDNSTPDDSLDNFYMVNKLPLTKSFTFTTSRAAEESSDFYDELEELSFSTSSSFTSLGRNNDLILPS